MDEFFHAVVHVVGWSYGLLCTVQLNVMKEHGDLNSTENGLHLGIVCGCGLDSNAPSYMLISVAST